MAETIYRVKLPTRAGLANALELFENPLTDNLRSSWLGMACYLRDTTDPALAEAGDLMFHYLKEERAGNEPNERDRLDAIELLREGSWE